MPIATGMSAIRISSGCRVAGLIEPAYLASRSALISPTATHGERRGRARRRAPRSFAPARRSRSAGTTHFVAVDRWGNVASDTSTIESGFGSGLTVNGYYLNNELTDFSFVPEKDGYAGRQPGRRRQAAAQLDGADHRLRARRPGPVWRSARPAARPSSPRSPRR